MAAFVTPADLGLEQGDGHRRLGRQPPPRVGRVLSHGQLSPGDPAEDWPDRFGMYQVPGGIPGVVDGSATGRRGILSSPTCPPGTIGHPGAVAAVDNATCKPSPTATRPPARPAHPAGLLLEPRAPD